MKIISFILFVIGAGLCAFGYWGMFTVNGNRTYDEMDGLYPFFAMLAGSLLICIALVLFIIIIVRRRKAKR